MAIPLPSRLLCHERAGGTSAPAEANPPPSGTRDPKVDGTGVPKKSRTDFGVV